MERAIANLRPRLCSQLDLYAGSDSFTCSYCYVWSSGVKRYRCSCCDFNLHGQCATAKDSLSFHGHPHHMLVLAHAPQDLATSHFESCLDLVDELLASAPPATGGCRSIPVFCEICTNEIQGTHYCCDQCGVFVHPLCALLPSNMSTVAHREHALQLFSIYPTACKACRMPCTWAYGCFRCLVVYHPNCLPETRDILGTPFGGDSSELRTPPGPFPPGGPAAVGGATPRGPAAFRGALPVSRVPSLVPNPYGGAFPFGGVFGRASFCHGGS